MGDMGLGYTSFNLCGELGYRVDNTEKKYRTPFIRNQICTTKAIADTKYHSHIQLPFM